MRTVLWLLLLGPVLLLLALFGLSNRQEVALRLWPLDLVLAVPLAFAVFAVATLAFLLGAAVTWFAGWSARKRARRLEDAHRLLTAELADLRARQAEPPRPSPRAPSTPHRPSAVPALTLARPRG